ncbi:MAG: hypothetical protein K2N88_02030 [Muribaculaceae bacterium]|nr:hypothetical protein [Muribaculaceae bacterium]
MAQFKNPYQGDVFAPEDSNRNRNGFDRLSGNRYQSPVPGHLPLIALLPNEKGKLTDSLTVSRMRRAGLNCMAVDTPASVLMKHYSASGSLPMPTLLMIDYFLTEALPGIKTPAEATDDVIPKLKEMNLRGIIMPVGDSFKSIDRVREYLRRLYDSALAVKAEMPPVIPMVSEQSVIPRLHKKGEEAEAPYLLSYLQLCLGPCVWATDSNLWRYDGNTFKGPLIPSMNDREIMAFMGIWSDRPTWGYVRCLPLEKIKNPALDYGPMLGAAFSALATGAQGLMFSDLRQGIGTPAPLEPGGKSGSIEPVLPVTACSSYDLVEPVVRRVRQFEGVFLGAHRIETLHTDPNATPRSDGQNPDYTLELTARTNGVLPKNLFSRMTMALGPLVSITGAKSEPAKVMVSHLSLMTDHTALKCPEAENVLDFLVVVNKNLIRSQTINIELIPHYQVLEVTQALINDPADRSANALVEKKISSSSITRTLAPGDILVLRWKPVAPAPLG